MWNNIKDFFVNLYDNIVSSDYYLWILGIGIVVILVILWFSMNKLNKKEQ